MCLHTCIYIYTCLYMYICVCIIHPYVSNLRDLPFLASIWTSQKTPSVGDGPGPGVWLWLLGQFRPGALHDVPSLHPRAPRRRIFGGGGSIGKSEKSLVGRSENQPGDWRFKTFWGCADVTNGSSMVGSWEFYPAWPKMPKINIYVHIYIYIFVIYLYIYIYMHIHTDIQTDRHTDIHTYIHRERQRCGLRFRKENSVEPKNKNAYLWCFSLCCFLMYSIILMYVMYVCNVM